MKKSIGSTLVLCLMVIALVIPTMAFGQETDEVLSIGFVDKQGAPLRKASTTLPERIVLDGTGVSKSIVVSTVGLTQDVKVSASSGLEVSPQVIAADAGEAVLTITNHSTLNHQSGRIILRSGDIRLRVNVEAMGTPLPVKDLSQNPVYGGGKDKQKTFEGFAPGPEGFTVELRAKTDVGSQRVEPFGVSGEGVGFKGYVGSSSIGLMNSRDVFVSEKGMSNPSNGGTFYNTDGEYHTYRYAVTGDERVFVYRDGIAIDTMRVADLALQPEWSTGNGPVAANLIRNGDFEGESDYNASAGITDRIEGWDVYPYDQYNSYQDISREERSNEVDQNNHVLEIHRYMWEGGWAAAEISQIVDVAPNEVYSFSCLAKGGIRSNGEQLGTIRIQDLQNDGNRVNLPVTSDSYQTYASDFTTQATTRQVRVTFLLERAAWGASVSAFKIDDVKLTGVSRTHAPLVGFDNNSGDIAYFNFDATGAYAPAFASLTSSVDTLRINGTGSSGTFTVDASNLTGDITLTATSGFEVSPSTLPANTSGATVTVKNLSTLAATTGKVVMRSGDKRKTVRLVGTGTPLPVKDLSQNPVYSGGKDKQKTFEGFAPGPDGFTVELRAKTDVGSQRVEPFGVSGEGVGFKGYVGSSGIGLMNSRDVFVSEKGMSNPSNGGTFYNTDGEYHTYRYAVTGDERVFVYRDGIAIDTMRVADLALQPEWSTGNGPVVANLIRNGDFEGESDYNASAGITDRIEGWDVYPYDQWNSTQSISSEERSNEVDQNNHVLEIHRYMWEGGWAAAEISQIVDVAPNEVYSFSCLAKGGIRSNGEQLGTIRIQDLQNDGNRVNLPVTSDSYQTYASDFTTQATTRQVRVTFLLERAAWGASVSAFKIDDVKLTGVSRTQAPRVGFDNNSGDIAYFNFDATGAYAPAFASLTSSVDTLSIDGTGVTGTFTVDASNLTGDVTLTATSGFEVSPSTLPANSSGATVTVKNLSTLAATTGKVVMRSGDKRKTVRLVGTGTPLPVKDLSQNPVYSGGKDKQKTFEGFAPGPDGFTVELRAKTDVGSQRVEPFGVSGEGVGFKGYVGSSGIGLMNSRDVFVSEKGMSNPSNGGTFYNTDGEYHTYRYAVTGDERVFVYRDGIAIDTMRVADLALQPEWSTGNGPVAANLIRNGDFEGESDYNPGAGITDRIEGWDVYPYDQWNSTQSISSEERSNEVDQNNHVLEIHRYMWEGGWAAAEISQIVDVAPNEVYSFSCLAKGGIRSNGEQLGAIRIQDLQNDGNRVNLPVTSDSYQTYASDFTTQATTQQVRVTFLLERAAWGASVSAFKIDDVKLTGVSRTHAPLVGFDNNSGDIAYFNFDATGAYAPAFASLTSSVDTLVIDGTGATNMFSVNSENLTGDISLMATHGFAVSPTTIKAGKKNVTVTVTNLATLKRQTGRVIMRAGDMRTYVNLVGIGTALPVKDLSQNPVYAGGDDEYVEFQDFEPSADGYSLEIKAKVDASGRYINPFAITEQGVGFKGYVNSNSMGLYNGKGVFVSEKGISNPANGGTFYNTDGLQHTYRYAVTSDKRVFVYRDGLPLDTMRIADLALQPEWAVATGPVARNLIKNGDFEGEYNYNSSRSITDRIEGWDVYPYDQYNSYQDISREERSNEVDQNNHVLEIHRYMWEGGWAAAEISQIVDVAPNEVYSFSCLAKGGIRSNGDQLGSIRIQDLQNDANRVTMTVNSDSYKTYAADFESQANTQQVRVTFMLERAAWGASVSAFKIDDVKMKGFSRLSDQKVGFENLDADVEYFNYDASGAYAPQLPGLDVAEITDAIQTATDQVGNLRVRTRDGQMQVFGVEAHSRVLAYAADGRQVIALPDVAGDTGFALPGKGVYIVAVIKDGRKQVLKAKY